MKVIIVVCSALFLATCIGADEDGRLSDSENGEERLRFPPAMCPKPDSRMHSHLIEVGQNCIKMSVEETLLKRLRNATTLEELRDVFNNICQRQPVVQRCLAETTVSMESCQNDTLLKTFKIYSDVIATVLGTGCNQDGEIIATLVYQMKDLAASKEKINLAKKCSDRFSLMFGELDVSTIDISSKMYIVHKEIVVFSRCFYQIELQQTFKDGLKQFMDVIINNMKCVDPQVGTLVSCVTIDAGLINTSNVCDVKTFGTELSLYDVLEEDTGAHLMDFLDYSDEDVENNDKIRNFVGIECRFRSDLDHLFNEPRMFSEVCLSDFLQYELTLFTGFIKSAYEVACLEDGRRPAEIMFEVYRLRKTGHGNAMYDCVDVAKSTRNATGVQATTKNMRFYHELEAFKGCLVNKLQGHQTSVDAATSLIDEMMKKVRCPGSVDGTSILCETFSM